MKKYLLATIISLVSLVSFGQSHETQNGKDSNQINFLQERLKNASNVFEFNYDDNAFKQLKINKLYFIGTVENQQYYFGHLSNVSSKNKSAIISKLYDNNVTVVHGHGIPENFFWFKTSNLKDSEKTKQLIEKFLTDK